jgi:uncharacterized protein YbjQ (UPF0145 family)
LSPRIRGVGGLLKGAFQSIGGDEITAFTTEIEKARSDAVAIAIQKTRSLGANVTYA